MIRSFISKIPKSSLKIVPNRQMSLSHIDNTSGLPTMVDVSDKAVTKRTAKAQAVIYFPQNIVNELFKDINISSEIEITSQNDIHLKKGAIFTTAIIAGTQAVKQTANLIPFCHPLPISSVKFKCFLFPTKSDKYLNNNEYLKNIDNTEKTTNTSQTDDLLPVSSEIEGISVRIECTTSVTHTTGVEMEALTGASVAALTVYDMVKALGHDITINEIKLLTKTGGKSDFMGIST